MAKHYPRIRRAYEKQWGHLDEALTLHAVDAILESVLAALTEDDIVSAIKAHRFRQAEEYRLTVRRLQEIARARSPEIE